MLDILWPDITSSILPLDTPSPYELNERFWWSNVVTFNADAVDNIFLPARGFCNIVPFFWSNSTDLLDSFTSWYSLDELLMFPCFSLVSPWIYVAKVISLCLVYVVIQKGTLGWWRCMLSKKQAVSQAIIDHLLLILSTYCCWIHSEFWFIRMYRHWQ